MPLQFWLVFDKKKKTINKNESSDWLLFSLHFTSSTLTIITIYESKKKKELLKNSHFWLIIKHRVMQYNPVIEADID